MFAPGLLPVPSVALPQGAKTAVDPTSVPAALFTTPSTASTSTSGTAVNGVSNAASTASSSTVPLNTAPSVPRPVAPAETLPAPAKALDPIASSTDDVDPFERLANKAEVFVTNTARPTINKALANVKPIASSITSAAQDILHELHFDKLSQTVKDDAAQVGEVARQSSLAGSTANSNVTAVSSNRVPLSAKAAEKRPEGSGVDEDALPIGSQSQKQTFIDVGLRRVSATMAQIQHTIEHLAEDLKKSAEETFSARPPTELAVKGSAPPVQPVAGPGPSTAAAAALVNHPASAETAVPGTPPPPSNNLANPIPISTSTSTSTTSAQPTVATTTFPHALAL